MKKRPILPVVGVIVLVLAACVYFLVKEKSDAQKAAESLSASGTIESQEVTISPEIGGKVVEVLVEEGQTVRTGEVLFRLDGTLLQAQRAVANSNLELARAAAVTADSAFAAAQSQYDLVVDAANLEAASLRTGNWRESNPVEYTLPGWYFDRSENLAAARDEMLAADSALVTAQAKLDWLLDDPDNRDFVAAEKRLLAARAAFLVADDLLEAARTAKDNTELQDSAQEQYDDAQDEMEKAQEDYDDLADTDAAENILDARADLMAAQERAEIARDRFMVLQVGTDSPRVVVAAASLSQAQAAAGQAQLAISQAEANLALLDVHLGKLTVTAPLDGVILTSSIQLGEVIAQAADVMTLALLDDLTITVYIPEDRYGELILGQAATVTVDSFPGLDFSAVVVSIADQAEFTPRNVQTVEGRKTTVFAIRLRVEDPQGKLKPGMPADVIFDK